LLAGITFLISPFIAFIALWSFPSLLSVKARENVNVVGLIIATAVPGLFYWIIAYTLLKKRIPKGYDAFEKNF
jgi:hypothetical protein